MKCQSNQRGFSLMELVIVLAIMGIITIIAISGLLHRATKAYDATRKSDLAKIKVAFEDFYNDNSHYPASSVLDDACSDGHDDGLQPYLDKIPCDPKTKKAYLYMPDASSGGYRVFAKLEFAGDMDSERLGCGGVDGCGVPDQPEYNYGISEGLRVALIEPPAPDDVTPGASVPATPTPTPDHGTEWCDYQLDSVCYVCSTRCNVCHVTTDLGSTCAGSLGSPQAFSSFQACLDYSTCTE